MRSRTGRWIKRQWQRALLNYRNRGPSPAIEYLTGLPSRVFDQPRILILKLDHIGDFILGMAAINELRRSWPQASISLVCGPWNTDLARGTKLFDHVFSYEFFGENANERRKITPALYTDFAEVNPIGSYDIAIDLRYDEDTRPLLKMVDATYRAGFAAPNSNVQLDLELPLVEETYQSSAPTASNLQPIHAETRLTLLALAVIAKYCKSRINPVDRIAIERSGSFKFRPNNYIVIAPGAGKTSRKWPLSSFVTLASELAKKTSKDIVVVGGRIDRGDGKAITDGLPQDRAHDLTGRLPIVDLPHLLSNSALFIGNDSGVTHLAARLNTPTICIFSGASDVRVWRPLGENVTTIRAPVPCSPCYIIRREDCPIDVRCLEWVTVPSVLSAALNALAAPP
jgi:ADP-heptose:LPS heptosyltransferase